MASLKDILDLALKNINKEELEIGLNSQLELLGFKDPEMAHGLSIEMKREGKSKRKSKLIDWMSSVIIWRLYYSFN